MEGIITIAVILPISGVLAWIIAKIGHFVSEHLGYWIIPKKLIIPVLDWPWRLLDVTLNIEFTINNLPAYPFFHKKGRGMPRPYYIFVLIRHIAMRPYNLFVVPISHGFGCG